MLTQGFDLTSEGYSFDDTDGIWRRDTAERFAYSDGDEVEESLAEVLRATNDLSILSPELAACCTDWPRRYHLNGARANLLRPLSHRLTGDILEIGAGCGAITRYLGECGGNVLALEGSQRRASIAALRTRDLQNVTVLNDRFDRFNPDRRFDVVTLIGVLEYAALFSAAADPVDAMLRSVRNLLNPTGILIVAIENQLGLKYFAGAPEDHVGIRMFGIHGLYAKPGVETFGRRDLEGRFAAAGFGSTELALPFPDYKLPTSILPPAALGNAGGFRPEILAAQSVTRDQQINSTVLTFALERAWRVVGRNGLLEDLANSFLFVASPAESAHSAFVEGELAYHYSVERLPAFCKATKFVEHDGAVLVQRERLSQNDPPLNSAYSHRITDESLVLGDALDEDFGRLVTTPGWRIGQIADIAHRYVEALFSIAGESWRRPETLTPEFLFPGEMLDIVPQNIVVSADGKARAIDIEWVASDKLSLGYLIFRALTLMLRSVSTCALPADLRWFNLRSFFAETFAHLGFDLTQSMIEDYLQQEANFMSFALGREIDIVAVQEWINAHLPSELDLQSQGTRRLLGSIDELSNRMIELQGERDRVIEREVAAREAEHAAVLAAHEARDAEASMRRELEMILRSNVWRATRPLRALASRAKRAFT